MSVSFNAGSRPPISPPQEKIPDRCVERFRKSAKLSSRRRFSCTLDWLYVGLTSRRLVICRSHKAQALTGGDKTHCSTCHDVGGHTPGPVAYRLLVDRAQVVEAARANAGTSSIDSSYLTQSAPSGHSFLAAVPF